MCEGVAECAGVCKGGLGVQSMRDVNVLGYVGVLEVSGCARGAGYAVHEAVSVLGYVRGCLSVLGCMRGSGCAEYEECEYARGCEGGW